jgi:hypothetical protein
MPREISGIEGFGNNDINHVDDSMGDIDGDFEGYDIDDLEISEQRDLQYVETGSNVLEDDNNFENKGSGISGNDLKDNGGRKFPIGKVVGGIAIAAGLGSLGGSVANAERNSNKDLLNEKVPISSSLVDEDPTKMSEEEFRFLDSSIGSGLDEDGLCEDNIFIIDNTPTYEGGLLGVGGVEVFSKQEINSTLEEGYSRAKDILEIETQEESSQIISSIDVLKEFEFIDNENIDFSKGLYAISEYNSTFFPKGIFSSPVIGDEKITFSNPINKGKGFGQDSFCPEGYYCLGEAVVDVKWNCNKEGEIWQQDYIRAVVDCKFYCNYEVYGRSCDFDSPDYLEGIPGAAHFGGCCAPIPKGLTLSDIRKQPLLTWEYMSTPGSNSLNMIRVSDKWYMFGSDPFSIISEGKYIPATLDDSGFYSLNPSLEDFIIIAGTYEGRFYWSHWSDITRVRDELNIRKFISLGMVND